MKECLDCNRDISDKGNRTLRCDKCQNKHRAIYKKKSDDKSHIKWNNKVGSARYNKDTYQWTKQIKKLSQAGLRDLVSCYRNRLIGTTGREKLDIKTRIKIICKMYKPNKLKETIKEVDHENAMLPHTEQINWDKAKTGWTNYYDAGLVTLSPEVFFGKWKVNN